MMSEFTAGPWSVPHFANDESGCSCAYVFSESQRGFGSVATVSFGGEDEDYETAKANARLISAAPELLEALQACSKELRAMIDVHNVQSPDDGSYTYDYQTVFEADQAIDKALASNS